MNTIKSIRHIFIIGLALLVISPVSAQEQFASRIIKYSSQAGQKGYGARQALGKPNALEYGKNPVAWSPMAPNVGMEYIEVGFDRPMKIQQVAVWENFNPGSIYEIHLIESNGKSHRVYQQDKPEKAGAGNRIFRYMMKETSYPVASLRLVLNTAGVYGLNQIDAIGISASSRPMESAINVPMDVNFAGKPENLGYQVNCEDPDLLPIISVDGRNLYFARKHHVNNVGTNRNDDIYISQKDSRGNWTEAANIGPPLNNEYNNFVCAVNPDGSELLLSGRYDHNGSTREGLHRTSFVNGKWKKPQPITIENYNNRSAFVCYHISPDMKYLVIAMEHPDTYGDMDIYVSFRKSDGRYSQPKNLGPTINTAGTEPSVFLSADGKTIYFSSDGHPGYGAYDMYMSRRLDNSWTSWTEPVNLGPKINTADWDLYYTVPADGEYAYYSSEYNSYGRSDLYRIKLPKDVRPEPVAILTPKFVDVRTNTPVAKVNKSNNTIIIQDDSKVNLYEEIKGYYPINESKDLSDELEEVDDFGQESPPDAAAQAQEEAMDKKMEDLLARLQELKNEQAKTTTEYEQALEPVSRHTSYEAADPVTAPRETGTPPTNSLDDRLAALRSDMERISSGESIAYNDPKEEAGKEYNVKPAYKSPKKDADRLESLSGEQAEILEKYQSHDDALSDFERRGNTSVRPKTPTKKYYDIRDSGGDGHIEAHKDYRDRLEQLRMEKDKAATSTQPLTKYALARTAIDEETERELADASLKSELQALKEKKEQPVTPEHPEVEAYRKKLEDLKNQDERDELPVSGTRITRNEEKPKEGRSSGLDDAVEVDEEVLAFQQKLEEMKARMNNIPSAQQEPSEGTRLDQAEQQNEEPGLDPVQSMDEARIDPPVADEPGRLPENNADKPRRNTGGRKQKQEQMPVEAEQAASAEPEIAQVITPADKTETENRVDEKPVAGQPELPEEAGKKVEVIPEPAAVEPNAPDAELAAYDDTRQELNEEIVKLGEETEAARLEKESLQMEKDELKREKEAMETQKQELQDIIAQLESERQAFLDEQKKLESDRKNLEQLRLQQHQQVRKLENEIAALEQEKGVALAAASDAKANSITELDPDAEIFLMPVEAGVTVEIRNVFFNANSFYIKPVSYKELDKVATFLQVNNNITVEIGGHTNGLCETNFCNSLSAKRAKAVTDYLVNKGIPDQRMEYKGYGKQFPVADNKTADGRKKNQRVELKIIRVE